MRNVLPICAGLVGISVIVSATMWNELRNERQLVAELRTRLAESSDQLAASLAAQRGAVAQATVAAPATAPVAKQPDAPADAAASARAAQSANADLILQARTREQELMADPEYRNARIAQQRLMMARNYPGLAEELGLSQKEADQVLDLLTENQMNMSNELTGRTAQDPAARAEIQRRLQELQRQQEDQLAALLGSRYPQWQAYRETQGSRQQAMQYGTQLAQAGFPLTDVQQRGLTSVLIAEQKRLQQDIVPMARSAANTADPQTRQQLEERAMRMQEESRNRTLDSAAVHLSARQIASLRQQFETEAAMTAAQRRLMQRQQALTEQVPVPVPAPPPP